MHRIRFRLGLCPRPRWGAYSAPQTPSCILRGLLLRGGGGKGGGREEKGRGRRGEGKGRGGRLPPIGESESGSASDYTCSYFVQTCNFLNLYAAT